MKEKNRERYIILDERGRLAQTPLYLKATAIIVFCAFLVIMSFFIRFRIVYEYFRVGGASMQPTFNRDINARKDGVFARKNAGLKHGDIVVLDKEWVYDANTMRLENRSLIKRVIALPGDEVDVRYVFNGERMVYRLTVKKVGSSEAVTVYEYFASLVVGGSQWAYGAFLLQQAGSIDHITIPAGNMFILGDNRNESGDSATFGYVPTKDVWRVDFIVRGEWGGFKRMFNNFAIIFKIRT